MAANERTRTIALSKVDDLTADRRLASTFASLVEEYAARRWNQLKAAPDTVARFRRAPSKRR
jgi:hypothetical protein